MPSKHSLRDLIYVEVGDRPLAGSLAHSINLTVVGGRPVLSRGHRENKFIYSVLRTFRALLLTILFSCVKCVSDSWVAMAAFLSLLPEQE